LVGRKKEKKEKKHSLLGLRRSKKDTKKEKISNTLSPVDTSDWKLTDFTRHETLGTGTFGRVYLVNHTETNKFYALKVLRKSLVVRLKQVQHVNNEKEILVLTNDCPFTVGMYKHFKDQKNLYLLFEYVQGGEVFSHLRAAGRFSVKTGRFYAAEIVLALEYLHKKKSCL